MSSTNQSWNNYFKNILNFFIKENYGDITEEQMEEYKMLSDFKLSEIVRIRKLYLEYTNGIETMSKDIFVNIEGIALNPLNDRICLIFEFINDDSIINFKQFLIGLAYFNSPGRREQKLKTAFRIQDFDNDGMISKKDLELYLLRITNNLLDSIELNDIITKVFHESSSDVKQEFISFADFQRIVTPLDFQAKLMLPI